MKITVRGFVDGKLHFEEFIEADINDPAALRPAIEKCTDAIGHFAHHMIELETLDENISPGLRVVRFGPDAPIPPSAIQRSLRN
jgi:hypothetical protein